MFELLFKYPPTVFAKGRLVLLAGWPMWVFAAFVVAFGAALAWQMRRRTAAGGAHWRRPLIWFLETAFLSLILLLLWHPAISIASLRPHENIVAVLVDDSRSMAIREDGRARLDRAVRTLDGGLLSGLRERFQVRVYGFGPQLELVARTDQLAPTANASRIGDALRQVAAESTSLPIGAAVLLSDGADTSGGIGLDVIAELKRRRLPVHTIGFGREHPVRDVELENVGVAARSLAGTRLFASVEIRQYGCANETARLVVRDGAKALASRDIVLKRSGAQTETILFNAGAPGARNLEFSVEPLPGEENARNNALVRVLNVEAGKPRALYIEGEPRWELKFIRRAIEEDRTLEIASILRTTENKIYRQGIRDPKELEEGFPSKAEELFAFQAVIIGSVDSGYFTPAQQQLLRDFVDRRGGALLFLGGRAALADGGYSRQPFADLLPVALPDRKGTFHRDPAKAEITAAGRESVILRLVENADANAERWKQMPALADYQETGEAKPGAVTLAAMTAGRRTLPLLVTENYGRGRTAVFATGGSWRWQMMQDHADTTHETFWQQLVRWLVAGALGPVVASTPKTVLADETVATIAAEVRDKGFRPVADARVEAHILGPGGASQNVELRPKPQEQGAYSIEWAAEQPGSYVAEVTATRGGEELGRDVVAFRREDGIAEDFRTGQNRELLEKLAAETGGRYYRPEQGAALARDVEYSEAGVTVRETRDLWDMPAGFLLALALRWAEWLLRRKWGFV